MNKISIRKELSRNYMMLKDEAIDTTIIAMLLIKKLTSKYYWWHRTFEIDIEKFGEDAACKAHQETIEELRSLRKQIGELIDTVTFIQFKNVYRFIEEIDEENDRNFRASCQKAYKKAGEQEENDE